MLRLTFLSVLTCLFILASGPPSAAAEAAREITLSGKLQATMAIGGETTGWVLKYQTADGKEASTDVDVTKVAKDAEKLDGKQVTVTGTMTQRQYPERGKVSVLSATLIVPAPAK